MSETRCYHCRTLLGDINAACPNCLPNWGRTYAPSVPQPDAPVSWEEEQYLHVKHENTALRDENRRLKEALEPFAKVGEALDEREFANLYELSSTNGTRLRITMKHLKAAHKALQPATPRTGGEG